MASEQRLDHNLFLRLFSYRPRDGHNPRENFLTEALAYVLATDARVPGPLVEALTGGALKGAKVVEVDTQVTPTPEGKAFARRCILDLVIHGVEESGQPFELWIENKWGAPFDREQLSRYHEMATQPVAREAGRSAHLAFVSQNPEDVRLAEQHMQSLQTESTRTALAWRSLHDIIDQHAEVGTVAVQFAAFLDRNGLGEVRKITLEAAKAFARKREGKKVGQAEPEAVEPFKRNLQAICSAVIASLEAARPTIGLSPSPHVAWGRVASISPGHNVSVGFLYNPVDHRTAFLDPDAPLDICIRVQAEARGVTKAVLERRREGFTALRNDLEKIGFDCNPNSGHWRDNRHTIVLGHYRPGMPWDADSGAAQVKALSKIFEGAWGAVSNPHYAEKIRELPAYSYTNE